MDVSLLLGAIAITLVTACWARVLVGHWWCRYGRQTGLAWLFLGALFSLTRFAQILGVGDAEMRSRIATYGYVIACLYVFEVTQIHVRFHRRFGDHQSAAKGG